MSFLIDDTLLRRLAEVNSFPVPVDEMVFFGLRASEDGIASGLKLPRRSDRPRLGLVATHA